MSRGNLLQLAFGATLALGLVAAALWRSPQPASPSAAPPARAAQPAAPSPSCSSVGAPGPAASPEPAAASGGTVRTTPRALAPMDEASLMSQLRSVASSDRAQAVRLAEEGNRRFPDSPDAPERASIRVHALAEEGQPSEARGAAEDMVNRYPDSSWVREVEMYTGAHRHRNVRLNDEGGVEYY